MGNSATAPPKRTATISSDNAPKMVLFWKTNFTPSFKLSIMGSPIFGFKIGLVAIWDKAINEKIEHKKTEHIDQ